MSKSSKTNNWVKRHSKDPFVKKSRTDRYRSRAAYKLKSIDEKYGNVIGIWRAKVLKGEPLPSVGDGNQKRDFVHVYDIVDGLIKIALSEINHDDAWELGTGLNYSVNELFNYFKDKFNVTSTSIPDQPGNYRQTLRENDDSLRLLGWKPKDRLRDHINNFK